MSLGDYLNGLQSGSSGRSSVSLNSLLSEYLQEMQQLADGTLLPKGASENQPPAGRVSLYMVYCLRLSAKVVCIQSVLLGTTSSLSLIVSSEVTSPNEYRAPIAPSCRRRCQRAQPWLWRRQTSLIS